VKNFRARSILLFLLILAFLTGTVFFVYELAVNSENWALKPYNEHLGANSLSDAGKILDRNSIILAQSINSRRVYNEDEKLRKAVFHLVGDEDFNISTSIQNSLRAKLFGYNFLTGLDVPWFFKKTNDIALTVDSVLCKFAIEKMQNYKGALCIYNYKTGEILCVVSTPTLDILNVPLDVKTNKDYDGVYLNKAISGTYAPGSVFKIITATSAFENFDDADKIKFTCEGVKKINSEKITCMNNHSQETLKEAMKDSCNIFFGDLAIKLGKQKMTKTAELLNFNKQLKIDDFLNTERSVYDVSKASEAQLGWSGIGQANNTVNPVHLMTICGSIANDGLAIMPKILKDTTNLSLKQNLNLQNKNTQRYMSSETANKLKDIMFYTVEQTYISNYFENLKICAKTGTAEVGDGKKPHAWTTGFIDDETNPLAFTIIVENSGFGGRISAPIIGEILKKAVE
jgi:peptidoglycan glycosyltransferase